MLKGRVACCSGGSRPNRWKQPSCVSTPPLPTSAANLCFEARSNMTAFQILDGLPPYGPTALPFPEDGQGAFREGLVVRFGSTGGVTWIGNFQRGSPTHLDFVVAHPDGRLVIVIAGGDGYFVDPESRRQTHKFGGGITFAQFVPDLNIVAICDALSFAAFSKDGLSWNGDRISWGGVRKVVVDGGLLHGEACSISGTWHRFELDLLSGKSARSIYQAEMAGAVRLWPL